MAIIDINIPIEDAVTDGSLNPVTSNAVFDALALKANSADLSTVATSGDYNDLSNLPTIPAAQVNSDWNATSGVAEILNKPTIPSVTNFVPYTGATNDVDLGVHDLTATQGTFATSGNPDTLTVNHSSGSGKALTITKGGNGEGVYVNKTSGSGNAVTIIGDLEATNLKRTGGTSSQFLKANGSIDSTSYQPTLVSGTNIKTVNGNSLLGSGDLVISGGGGSGIFGISDASGVYTYYATLTLAMAAATSGQTIEMFADFTQATTTNIELKVGVNINGNGHTYTYSANDTTYALNQTNAGVFNIKIINITILRTVGTGGCINQNFSASGNIHFDGTLLRATGGGICFFTAGAFNFYNLTAIGTTSAAVINYWASGFQGYFINCSAVNTSSGAGFQFAGGGNAHNCYGESNSGFGFNGLGFLRNCVGRSVSSAGIYGQNSIFNCTGFSVSGYGIDTTNSNQIVGCTGTSVSSIGIFVGGSYISKCTGISNSGVGMQSGTGSLQVFDCDGFSTSNFGGSFGFIGGNLIGGKFQSNWNNAGGHALNILNNINSICNVTLVCTNASAYNIFRGTAYSLKITKNLFIGGQGTWNPLVTNSLINIEDAQGNIKI